MGSYNHNTGTFIGRGSNEIFFQSWVAPKSEGIVVIVHGLGEHSGRYSNIINELDGKNMSIYAPDHRGHGKSGGKRGHINSFMDYIYDLKIFIDLIKEDSKKLPLILLGHSMGGVIALKYALTYPEDISHLILSSSGFVPTLEVPEWKTGMAGFLSKYIPTLSMSNGLNLEHLSHDSEVIDAYENDPLVHDRVSSRWYVEFTNACQECLNRASELKLPLLIFHGKNDMIVSYKGSEKVYENASSKNKELHIFDNLYHEAMNEIKKERKKVLSIVSKWILKRTRQKKSSVKKPAVKPSAKSKVVKKSAAKKKTAVKSKSKAKPKVKAALKPKVAVKKAKKGSSGKSAKKSSKKK